MEFAGSGHLVITTSHASSVVEAMSRIFKDTETETAAQRSEIARRILGIINLRSTIPELEKKAKAKPPSAQGVESRIRALVPALWKRTPQSMNSLIADGLASLLPSLAENPTGYYGRTYFASQLTSEGRINDEITKADRTAVSTALIRKAREWDIEGG